MKILAIDTSALVASVALMEDETPIAVYSQMAGKSHSETMLPMIEGMLGSVKLPLDEIDLFAVSEGPGSFTGIRIGVSLIKGLAFAKKKPCVGVSTLAAMAKTVGSFAADAIICPVMDARRNQLYNAIFEVHGEKLLRLTPDRLMDADDLMRELSALQKPVIFLGDGYPLVLKKAPPFQRMTPPAYRGQNAVGVALAAKELYENAADPSVFSDTLLRPDYLRATEAERNADAKDAQTK